MKKKFFPIFVDITSNPVLVIGAGNIAYRKIMNLLEFSAQVVCIAPNSIDKIDKLAQAGKIELINREYQPGDCRSYRMIFAATDDPETDKRISEECIASNSLLNVADVPDLCTFIMPAYVKYDDITFAISTAGNAPFFAKYLKDKIKDSFPEQLGSIANLASYFRNFLVKAPEYSKQIERDKFIKWFLSYDWLSLIHSDGLETAKQIIEKKFKDVT